MIFMGKSIRYKRKKQFVENFYTIHFPKQTVIQQRNSVQIIFPIKNCHTIKRINSSTKNCYTIS